jgi:polyhydroxybutyrate depolymerase
MFNHFMRKKIVIGFAIIILIAAAALSFKVVLDRRKSPLPNNNQSQLQNGVQSIEVNGVKRDFILYLPPNFSSTNSLPLLFVFHGGGSDMTGMQKATNWDSIAAKEGFVVVYPNGINKNWNDGRLTQANIGKELGDDTTFVAQLSDYLLSSGKINPNKVFATGVSNGGFMSQKVACDLTSRFAAIAPIATAVSQTYVNDCKHNKPIPIIWFEGTSDPLIPFNGGELTNALLGINQSRGTVLSSDESIKFWNQKNGCNESEQTTNLPDTNKLDGSTVTIRTFCANSKTPLIYYQINGGGHTWPRGPQYLPRLVIGNVNQDVDSEQVIWEFFKSIS